MARAIDKDYLLTHKRKVRFFGIGPDDESWGYAVPVEVIENATTLTPPNESLTIEQLREMDGCPVYVVPKNELSELKGWCVVFVEGGEDDYSGAYPPGIDNWCWSFERYMDQWLAYTYPPAHIDREEWTAEWEWFDEDIGNPLDGIERDWGWWCSKCGYILPDNFDNPDSPPKMKYCSACGRAMTSEAWAEMAKRLRG